MGRKNREGLDIIACILRVCEEGARKTRIMNKANLSFEQANRYLRKMMDIGLLQNDPVSGCYVTSHRGMTFLREYTEFRRVKEAYDSTHSELRKLVTARSPPPV